MNVRELPTRWDIPRGRFVRLAAILVPLALVGVLLAMYMEGELSLSEIGLTAVLMAVIIVILFAILGRMAHRIERESDTLIFVSVFGRTEMRIKEIRCIRCMSSTPGLMSANQNFNFLEITGAEGKVKVAGLFNGFIDLVNTIREQNPELVLEGL